MSDQSKNKQQEAATVNEPDEVASKKASSSSEANNDAEANHSSQKDMDNAEEAQPHNTKDTESYHDNDRKSEQTRQNSHKNLLSELRQYQQDLDDDLRWKENLKLLTLDAMISPPYYNLWRKESNMIYRRSVIIRKRYRGLAQKKDQT